MSDPTAAKKMRKRRRRQKGLLTALGVVFATSAVLRLGALDYAVAEAPEPDIAPEVDVALSTPIAALTEPLRAAMDEIDAQRAVLNAREVQLDDRETAVAAAQVLVERRLAELEAAEERLQALINMSDGAAENDLDRLTSVYETMNAEQVAPLFEQMDPSFAAGFLSRMAAPAGAAVMAELSPEFAYAVSVVMATRNATAPTFDSRPEDTEN